MTQVLAVAKVTHGLTEKKIILIRFVLVEINEHDCYCLL